MNENMNNEIGRRLFIARKEKGLTRAELGSIIGLHESTIKRYEDGHIKNLTIEKIQDFSTALNTDPSYFMGWDDEPQKINQLDTIAAHFEGYEFSKDDLDDIENFIKFIKSKKK